MAIRFCEYLEECSTCYGCWLEDRGLYEYEINMGHGSYWCPSDNRSQVMGRQEAQTKGGIFK